MALVMLPCDLPWWSTVQRHLLQISKATTSGEFVEGMHKIHNLCNISLDPEDDEPDATTFDGLTNFLDNVLNDEERLHFLGTTAPSMVRRAMDLKQLKPPAGFHFSLQQQADNVEYERSFVASLLANAFFSTFPKRTEKTHPTLQDFNFTHFYRHLDNNFQQAKLRSILHYFDYIEANGEPQGKITFSRKVMSSKEWLTIEDWLECSLPLCHLAIKHEGRICRAEANSMRVCFSSSRVGGPVLRDGASQESIQFCTKPELLAMLPSFEALEDNEVLSVQGLQQVSRILDPRNKATLETLETPLLVNVCCMDAECYVKLPLSQFMEDNVLRELNKALLGFRQQQKPVPLPRPATPPPATRRLTPIGESFSSTPETERIVVQEPSPVSLRFQHLRLQKNFVPLLPLEEKEKDVVKDKEVNTPAPATSPPKTDPQRTDWLSPASRRGRFIVLGSSGECLPVTRMPVAASVSPVYSSCPSDGSSDEFHSAQGSLDGEEIDTGTSARKYSAQLDTPERRSTFAERLRDALCRETISCSSSTDSSYAVGISVAGSDLADPNIRLRRGGSRGFMLQEDSIDDQFLRESLQQEREWIDKFRSKRPGALSKRETAESSKYSFSTEYSSELEELYDQFSRWLDDSGAPDTPSTQELNARDLAVVKFAGSLLKRTLSESFAGVSVTEVPAPVGDADADKNRGRIAIAARSLSLELARHKHKLAAQLIRKGGTDNKKKACRLVLVTEAIIQTLETEEYCFRLPSLPTGQVSMLTKKDENASSHSGLRPVSTGNWGCGSKNAGDPQLKLIIQWLAGSVAGVPTLAYYTCGDPTLHKLDTVCRVLYDRQWTVGELINAVIKYSQSTLNDPTPSLQNNSLFDALIGTEKSNTQD